jgi:hypothetical protein
MEEQTAEDVEDYADEDEDDDASMIESEQEHDEDADCDSFHGDLIMRWLDRWINGTPEERQTRRDTISALSLPVTVGSAPTVRRPVQEVLCHIRCGAVCCLVACDVVMVHVTLEFVLRVQDVERTPAWDHGV